MATNEYIDLDKAYEVVEKRVFCEALDSLDLSSRLRNIMANYECRKEVLFDFLKSYINSMQERLDELEEIQTKLESEEVTE